MVQKVKKCNTRIKDISSYSIEVTLWGHHCENEGQQILNLFRESKTIILLIKSAHLLSWSGKSLDTIFSTNVLINPNLTETTDMFTWCT